MTVAEMRARADEIRGELRGIHDEAGDSALTDDQQERWDALEGELQTVERDAERTEARLARVESLGTRGSVEDGDGARARDGDRFTPANVNTKRTEDPYDLDSLRSGLFTSRSEQSREAVDRARAAVEAEARALPDEGVEFAMAMLDRHVADEDQGERVSIAEDVARRILTTGSRTYQAAFRNTILGRPLTNDQAQAAQRALEVGTTTEGGFAVPYQFDPTLIFTADGAVHPFRQISRVVQTTVKQWKGVSMGAVTAQYRDEEDEMGDNSPTLAGPTIDAERADVFVPFSFELDQDWPSLRDDLRFAFQDAKNTLEATKYVSGSGTLEPTGIVTALDGTSSEVAPATAETFAVADVYGLETALPDRYLDMARWIGHRGTYSAIRQFADNDGPDLWERIGAGVGGKLLLGYPTHRVSSMDNSADIDTGATEDNFILVLGDFRYYVIVDRIGMNVELVPHLVGTNHRPTGQRGIFAFWRNGADSVNDGAFRMLSIPTAA